MKLIDKILQASNQINLSTLKGTSQYIVVSSDFAEMLMEVENQEKIIKQRQDRISDLCQINK